MLLLVNNIIIMLGTFVTLYSLKNVRSRARIMDKVRVSTAQFIDLYSVQRNL